MTMPAASAETLSGRALIGAAALALLTMVVVVALSVAPRSGRAVAVLAWPGDAGEAVDVVARAGGELLASGAGGFIIAQSGDGEFASRLYRAGAWLVVDAAAARWCLARKPLPERGGR